MDPNTALVELRSLLIDMQKGIDSGKFDHMDMDQTATDLVNDVSRITDLFDGLDTWLIRGGFLPDDWQKNREK